MMFFQYYMYMVNLSLSLSLSLSLCLSFQPPAVEKEEELKDLKDRAQVRFLLWLGLEKDQEKWTECCGGGEVAVFAETVSLKPHTTCCTLAYQHHNTA